MHELTITIKVGMGLGYGEKLTRSVYCVVLFWVQIIISIMSFASYVCISGILGKANVLLDVEEVPGLVVRGPGLAGSGTAECSQSFPPSWHPFISDFVAILRKQFVLLFSCSRFVNVSLSVRK